MLLSSDISRTDVYADYVDSIKKLAAALQEHVDSVASHTCIKFSGFTRVRGEGRGGEGGRNHTLKSAR